MLAKRAVGDLIGVITTENAVWFGLFCVIPSSKIIWKETINLVAHQTDGLMP